LAYNFLGLVNDVGNKFNEVDLTSANFAAASGYYADAKKAVNSAINRINFNQYEWPFNHMKVTLPLVINQIEYDYETSCNTVVMDSFRIKGDDLLNVNTRKLEILDYEEFLDKFADAEFRPENYQGVPEYVYRGRNLKFGVYPPPNDLYSVVYECYKRPVALELWDAVPTVPEEFRDVIYEGSLYHAYMFRGDIEAAALSDRNFKDLIKEMRKVYINRTEYVRSSQIR
jgi:hypothetical protein